MKTHRTSKTLRRRTPTIHHLWKLTAGHTPERQQEASQAWHLMAAQTKAHMIQDARDGDLSLMRLHRASYRGAVRLAGLTMPRSRLRHHRR